MKTTEREFNAENAIRDLMIELGLDPDEIVEEIRTPAMIKREIKQICSSLGAAYALGKAGPIARWEREIRAREAELDYLRYGRTDVR